MPSRSSARRRPLWYTLLLVPFVGTLWVPFYNAVEPRLGGVPYFYWYQFLWIAIGAALTAVVYLATREPEPPGDRRAPGVARDADDAARTPRPALDR